MSRHLSAAIAPATSQEQRAAKHRPLPPLPPPLPPPHPNTATIARACQPTTNPPHHRACTRPCAALRRPSARLLHAHRRLVGGATSFSKPSAGCSARLETFRSAPALHQGILDTELQRRSGIKPGKLHPTATATATTIPPCPPHHSILPSRPALPHPRALLAPALFSQTHR